MFKNGKEKESKNINVKNACIAFGINGEKFSSKLASKSISRIQLRETNLQELSKAYGRSRRTLRKYFDTFSPRTGEVVFKPNPVCVIFDATFFGRSYGILIARAEGKSSLEGDWWRKDPILRRNSSWNLFLQSLLFLVLLLTEEESQKSLEHKFSDTPIQLCQFHQIQSITDISLETKTGSREKKPVLLRSWQNKEENILKRFESMVWEMERLLKEKQEIQIPRNGITPHKRLLKCLFFLKQSSLALSPFKIFQSFTFSNDDKLLWWIILLTGKQGKPS